MTGMKKHLLSAPALCMLAGISTAQADTYTVPAPLLAPSNVSAESARLPTPNGKEWDSFHGQLSAQKYSPLTQINKDNVGNLTKVLAVLHRGHVHRHRQNPAVCLVGHADFCQ